MDSRTALRGSFVSKQVVAIALVIAVILLGITAAIVARSLAPAAAGSAGNGSVTFAAGPAFDDTNRHHGTQSLGGSDASAASYRQPSDLRGGPKD